MRTIRFIPALVLVFAAFSLQAQSFQDAFFLDGYRLAYRDNPAFSNEGSVLSVGQWSSVTRNNVGASSFLYPAADGKVVTALHESVPAATFLGRLRPDNSVNGAVNYNLFSYGWRAGEAYHTLELNVRMRYEASVPEEIFRILKLGTGEAEYDLSGARVAGNAYAEIAYGYSRKLSDVVSVGARAKLLLGLASARYDVTRFRLTLTQERYQAIVEADLDLTSRMGKIRTDADGYLNVKDISAKDKWRLPAGAGLAFDLGVAVTPMEGLTLSASVLDLGALLWYYGNAGNSVGLTYFTGLREVSAAELRDGALQDEFDALKEDFRETLRLKGVERRVRFEPVPLTLNLGAKYALPFYDALTVGVTGSLNGWGRMAYREARAAVAWNPDRRIGVTANAGYGDFGPVYGAALSLGIRGFHLNVGLQNGFGGTVPYTGTPLKANNKFMTIGLTYDI